MGGTMRDFTPRRFDAAAGTTVIDYALHAAGPASDWRVVHWSATSQRSVALAAQQSYPNISINIG
jgi:NADPH-dependent ferric siderophore reductase